MSDKRDGEEELAEEAQAAIRDGIERARELLCEAKFVIGQEETPTAEPPIQPSDRHGRFSSIRTGPLRP